MASINQNRYPNPLPDFRNLGVILRVLVIVTGITLLGEALRTFTLSRWLEAATAAVAFVLPVTIVSVLALGAATPWLRRIDYGAAIAAILVFEVAVVTAVAEFAWMLVPEDAGRQALLRYWFFTVVVTMLLVGYFNLRNRALSPALTEALLQALQARIRPHFLFNSINAVLSLMRAQPRRAESALEDLADLFRVLMADNRDLVPLEREIELCRQYLGIEELRLGERLKVQWQMDDVPEDALVPPLILQPLLENAVYHGIEPAAEPGTVTIDIRRKADQLEIALSNPYRGESRHQSGNKMALANIRERLQLHFDAEASLATRAENGSFKVRISLPYVKEE